MLAGSLNEFGLADVFSLLGTTRKTGVLNLEGQGAPGRVWIASGALCFAASDITRSPLAARLLHGGQIDEDQVEVLVTAQADGSSDAIPDALAAFGMDGEQVRGLLLDQIVDAVFDLSRWQGGTFAFDQRIEEDPTVPVVAAAEVLETVAARLQEWGNIAAVRPAPDSVLTLVSRPPVSGGFVQVQPGDWEVLTLVDGLRTVADIIELTGQGEFTVSKVLARLVENGLVQGRDDVLAVTLAEQRRQVLAEAEQRLLGAVGMPMARPSSARPGYGFEPASEAAVNGYDPSSHRGLVDGLVGDGSPHTAVDHGELADQLNGLGRHDASVGHDSEDHLDQGDADGVQPHDVTDHADDESLGQDDPAGQAEVEQQAQHDPAGEHGDGDGQDSEQDSSDADPSDADPAADAAPTGGASVDPQRARELAAFGLGDPQASGQAEEAPKPLVRDTSVNADLLARLINGVKGA